MADPALPPGFTIDESPAPAAAPRRAPPKPAGLNPAQAKAAWTRMSNQFEQSIAGADPATQRQRRAAFYADPKLKQLETIINTPQTAPTFRTSVVAKTKQQEIQDLARQRIAASKGKNNALASTLSAVVPAAAPAIAGSSPEGFDATVASALDTASFGLGDKLRAGIGALSNGQSYDDNLALAREETRQRTAQSGAGNVLGMILGSVPSAMTGAGLAEAAAASLGTKAPTLARIIGGAEKMGVPEKVARLATSGATLSAANAAGHDENVGEAAALGAIAAPALVGAGKAGAWLGKKAAAILNLGSAAQILKRVTSATVEEMQAKLAEARARGVEPTLFELLPLADRNRVAKKVVSRSDATLERTQQALQPRLQAVGPEMAAVVNTAAAPGRAKVAQDITDAMASARGGTQAPGDAAVAVAATRQPDTLAAQAGREARLIMAPHDRRTLYANIDELMPSHPELQADGQVHNVPDDPAVTAMIRTKAKLLNRKDAGEASGGLTGRNISDLLGELRAESGNPNNPARDVARSAVQHIEDMLAQDHPEFLAAHQQMNDAYAASRRMVEGASEGMRTRTQASRDPDAINQASTNAYTSPEGASGRMIGQANRLQNTFQEAALDPERAIAAAAKVPGNAAAISQNMGAAPAQQILDAAATQREGMQALAGLNSKTGANAETFGPEELAATVLGLNPASMIRTKIMSTHKLLQAFGIPQKKAAQLVDMMFSTDPAARAKVLAMLNKTPTGRTVLSEIGGAIGQFTQQASSAQQAQAETPAPAADASAEPPLPEGFTVDQGGPSAEASPYAAMLEQVTQSEDPAMLDLIERQFNQESGGHQFGTDGRPTESPKGALGVAQIMPATAPTAAALAGLPLDEHALKHDHAYNKVLGMAYMKAQLEEFDGDAAKALAAYNAGPGRVKQAVREAGQNWLEWLRRDQIRRHGHSETYSYVRSILR